MSPRSALIVDPDPAHAHQLAAVLLDMGFRVRFAERGDEAEDHLQREPPELLVLELSLPVRDGFAVLAAMRERGANVAAVVVSAFPALRAEAFDRKVNLGVAAILPRDCGREDLQRAIRRAVPTLSKRQGRPPITHQALVDGVVPQPIDAQRRAADAVRRLVVEAGPDDDGALQTLAEEVRAHFGVALVAVSVVFEGHQWHQAMAGALPSFPPPPSPSTTLPPGGTPSLFCRHLVEADVPQALVVPDARSHPLFHRDPLVTSGAVGSYVGAPLVLSSRVVVGALCLMDRGTSRFSNGDVQALMQLARRASALIELRLHRLARAPRGRSAELLPTTSTPVADGNVHQEQIAIPATALAHDLRLMGVLDHLDVAVLLLVGPERRIEFANRALGQWFGLDVEALIGQPRSTFVDLIMGVVAHPEAARAQLLVPAEGAYVASAELELAHPERRVLRWAAKPIVVDGVVYQMATFTDVTADVDLARANARAAWVDPLTGLLNRRGFLEQLKREQARASRTEEPISVALFDIDHFKRVNDTFGHHVGDEVLSAVAAALQEGLRGADVAARWGGEEFLLALPGETVEEARQVCDRLRRAVEALETRAGKVTISAGVAAIEGSFEAAVVAADKQLYAAKSQGRNRVL